MAWKKIIISTACLVLIAVGISWWTAGDRIRNYLERRLVLQLQKATGGEVKIGGLRYRLIPPLLEAGNLSFQGRYQNCALSIKSDSARLSLRLHKLFFGKIALRSRLADHSQIDIECQDLPRGIKEKRPLSLLALLPSLSVDLLEVRKGRFSGRLLKEGSALDVPSFDGKLSLSRSKITLELSSPALKLALPMYEEFQFSQFGLKARYDSKGLTIQKGDLQWDASALSLRGKWMLQETPAPLDFFVQMKGELKQFQRFSPHLQLIDLRGVSTARFSVKGPLSDLNIQGGFKSLSVTSKGGSFSDADGRFRYEKKNLHIDALHLKAGTGGLVVRATIGPPPAFKAAGTVTFDHFPIEQVKAFSPHARGEVSGGLECEGTLAVPFALNCQSELKSSKIDIDFWASLALSAASLKSMFKIEAEELRISSLQIFLGEEAPFHLSGTIPLKMDQENLSLQYDLPSLQLSALRLKDHLVNGAMSLRGTVRSKRAEIAQEGTVRIENLKIDGKEWGNVEGNFGAEGKKISLRPLKVVKHPSAELSFLGYLDLDPSPHFMSGDLQFSHFPLLTLLSPLFPRIDLSKELSLAGSLSGKGKISGPLLLAQIKGDFALTIDNFGLLGGECQQSRFAIHLDPGLRADVASSCDMPRSEFSLTGRLFEQGSSSQLLISNLYFKYRELSLQNREPISAQFSRDSFALQKTQFVGPDVDATLWLKQDSNQKLSGELKGTLSLALLPLTWREFEKGSGPAQLTLTVGGTFKKPEFFGSARLENGSLKLAFFPHPLEQIHAELSINQKQLVIEECRGQLGGGTIDISGEIFWKGKYQLAGEIKNATVKYPPWLTSQCSGNLLFKGEKEPYLLSGNIEVTETIYREPIRWKTALLKVKKEVPRIISAIPPAVAFDIHVGGPGRLLIRNNLIRADLKGEIQIIGNDRSPNIAGTLELVEGTFTFRETAFTLTSGTVRFDHPVSITPYFQIGAEAAINRAKLLPKDLSILTPTFTYQIFLTLTGTPDDYDLSLSSQPPLAEQDILALLTYGMTRAEMTAVEQQAEEFTAIEMGSLLLGGIEEPLTEQTRKALGISVKVGPAYSSTQQATVPKVTISKEIEDRLFMSFTSIFETESLATERKFGLQYQLTDFMALDAQLDDKRDLKKPETEEDISFIDAGADLRFHFTFK
ncbi:MAG: translocation/assembly module TamB domain-containing protein [Deltaproteobacteria bacterium]|nr:translocation/assembly module TamB domain-containing protein [Deltaproteobacteria bacterium]